MRWTTSGVATVIRTVGTSAAGIVILVMEELRDSPHPLMVAAGLVMAGVVPASAAVDWLTGRRPGNTDDTDRDATDRPGERR